MKLEKKLHFQHFTLDINFVKEFKLKINIFFIIFLALYAHTTIAMEKKLEASSSPSFEWDSGDDSSGSNDTIAISKSSSETSETSRQRYIRELYSGEHEYKAEDKTDSVKAKSQPNSKLDSENLTAPTNQSNTVPILTYPSHQTSPFSSNKESDRRAKINKLNNSMNSFRQRAQYYADRDAHVKRYLNIRNQLNTEDQEKLARENKKLHKLAMKQLEYENRPSTGERIKQGLKSLVENISATKQRISDWLQISDINENKTKKEQLELNDYKAATAEQSRNARYNDYKNATAEQQGNFSKRQREQDYKNSIHEQAKFMKDNPEAIGSGDKITKKDFEFIEEQALREKEIEQKAAEEQSCYEQEVKRLAEKFETEQVQHKLDETIEKNKTFAERSPFNELPKNDSPRLDTSDSYLDTLDDFSFIENNRDDPFSSKECELDQDDKRWTQATNTHEILSSIIKDLETSAVDLLTTGRHESKHIDPKIVNMIINDPSTPKNIVKLLGQANTLQNSTNSKQLRDLSITTTELIVYAQALSQKIVEEDYKSSQEEARLNNIIKDKIIDIATELNDYINIAIEEVAAQRNANIEQPLKVITTSIEAAGRVALECGKLAVVFAPLLPSEHIALLRNLSPENSSSFEKKSLEELNKIVHSIEHNLSEFAKLSPKEQFRTAVRVGINAASLVIVAKTCSQVQESLRTSAHHVHDLKNFANTAQEIAALESSAQLIAQEQKFVHVVEQVVESNLVQASEHIPGTQKFTEKLETLAKEFAESETGKKIGGARLEKKPKKYDTTSKETSSHINKTTAIDTLKYAEDKISNFAKISEKNSVWSKITPTQEFWPHTYIPKSFTIECKGKKIWFNANATEHLMEYIAPLKKLGRGHINPLRTPWDIPAKEYRLSQEMLLDDFYEALELAIQKGIHYEYEGINAGNWKIVFSEPNILGGCIQVHHIENVLWKKQGLK